MAMRLCLGYILFCTSSLFFDLNNDWCLSLHSNFIDTVKVKVKVKVKETYLNWEGL